LYDLYRWCYRHLTELLYRRFAHFYDLVSAVVSLGRWDAWRRIALDFVPDGKTLELGFGTGHLQTALADSGRQCFGVDLSPEMVARASRRLGALGKPRSVVQSDAGSLPFSTGSFSAVVATFPAAYITERNTLRETARVLSHVSCDRQAGRLIVTGLWVTTQHRWLSVLFAPFYGSPDKVFLSSYLNAIRDSDLDPAIVETRDGRFAIGSVVAVRHSREQR
jgi:ubiquinone/menaquinone biosynthesis C-methylase UbiE